MELQPSSKTILSWTLFATESTRVSLNNIFARSTIVSGTKQYVSIDLIVLNSFLKLILFPSVAKSERPSNSDLRRVRSSTRDIAQNRIDKARAVHVSSPFQPSPEITKNQFVLVKRPLVLSIECPLSMPWTALDKRRLKQKKSCLESHSRQRTEGKHRQGGGPNKQKTDYSAMTWTTARDVLSFLWRRNWFIVTKRKNACRVCNGTGHQARTCPNILLEVNSERADAFFKQLVLKGKVETYKKCVAKRTSPEHMNDITDRIKKLQAMWWPGARREVHGLHVDCQCPKRPK